MWWQLEVGVRTYSHVGQRRHRGEVQHGEAVALGGGRHLDHCTVHVIGQPQQQAAGLPVAGQEAVGCTGQPLNQQPLMGATAAALAAATTAACSSSAPAVCEQGAARLGAQGSHAIGPRLLEHVSIHLVAGEFT